ncbi:MAG: hypothetical protein ACE5KG_05125 [Nitrososphaerales archaeon]
MQELTNALKGYKTHLIVAALVLLNLYTSDSVLSDAGVNFEVLTDSLKLGLISTFRSALDGAVSKLSG